MKSKKWICAIALMLFAAISTASASTTWYVNGVSGSDSNNCMSATTACKTIGHAISLALSGDSIRVYAATYYESLSINLSLVILGSGASTTIIDGSYANNRVVTISNTSVHVTLSQLTIRNGKATSGAGIANSGTLKLTNTTVNGNLAPVPCTVFSFLICVVRAGTPSGGGIYNSGTLTITNSTISGNHAGSYCTGGTFACAALGGGIYNQGTLMIKNSTFTGNSAGTACTTSCGSGFGGAIYTTSGTVTLNNSTVEGNSAYRCLGTCSGTGAAVFNTSGNLTLNNSTVSGNNNTVGGNSAGGIFNGGTAMLQNTIIANNSGTNCDGTITSHGYNLSSDSSCAFTNSGDRNNTDPQLGPLQNNGGPTPTMALPSGSPAVDAGNPTGCRDSLGNLLTTDQRGAQRPDTEDSGRGCDIGAFERQSD